jgi:energy-coupling factor transport system ATP-binding protein
MKHEKPLEIENLKFRYRIREEYAFKDINLSFEAGKVTLIAGSSGCGKTTLIRCINGLIPRSYKGEFFGKIYLHGKEISNMKLAQISEIVGTVLQDPERQILGTKVLNEVAFGLENLHYSRSEILERVEDALNLLNITQLKDRDTFNLSGGEKQKIALAGVLAMRPSILLLDEPLASLDPASAEEALQTFRTLADRGMTILLVEHRVEDVLKIHPERVLFFSEGEVRYDGSAQALNASVDYREVKLPAPIIIDQVRQNPIQSRMTFPQPIKRKLDTPLVEFHNVSFYYQEGIEVLHNVTFNIYAGDRIAVLGPNGAGKTTLIKHSIGLLKPKSGQVIVQGKDTKDLSVAEIAKTLGYVFQSPSHMLFAPTVEEELSFGPRNLGHAEETIGKEVNEALEIVNLPGLQESPPLALSFGQQKRVSIASVLAMRSKILIMDEPSAGQDYRNYIEFMDSIINLPNFESILFITHDIDLAVIYANRVLIVNEGELKNDGTPMEVLKDFQYLRKNRLVPTSLLQTNLDYLSHTGRFARAEELAQMI